MVYRSFYQRVLAILFPEHCSCCGKVIECGALVCPACQTRLLPVEPPVCQICGVGIADCTCGKHAGQLERCASPFYHEASAREALHRLKFSGKATVAEFFGVNMAQTIQREYAGLSFDCLVPVPISTETLGRREYNQSALLATDLSGRLHIPCREILIKQGETTPQRELPAFRRSGNVLGVFDVDTSALLPDSTILLVDDTVTTGATLEECAKMLKLFGAKAVYAVTATISRLPNTRK